MMPDLGKYAVTVLAAYGASLALIAGLVGLTLWQGAGAKRKLDALERNPD
ncbi:heme exporter protein CcmD [Rhodobacter sp. KR11]|jgi:heme exporter protein D|nr:heme exporter protein CcmD [Rhodobacter sp. KR11]MCW1917745.1 heme exporter protein CcmD [Rhodobacter sp. KR11]